MSSLLTEPLRLYLSDLEFAAVGVETPYLFHPSDACDRCVTSSQWSGIVKAVLKKFTGKAAPPKLYARLHLIHYPLWNRFASLCFINTEGGFISETHFAIWDLIAVHPADGMCTI